MQVQSKAAGTGGGEAAQLFSASLHRSDKAAFDRTMAKIERLGLSANLSQLILEGYTVVKGALSPDTTQRARDAILRRVEEKTGKKIDPATATPSDFHGMQYQSYLIFSDPVFQEILLAEKPLALMTFLLGESCLLSSMGTHARGPGGLPLAFHADGAADGIMSQVATVANCNYALTPYSQEEGALVIVPRSHLKQRAPMTHENWRAGNVTLEEIEMQSPAPNNLSTIDWELPEGAVTMKVDPGDAIIFHGNTWHGGWRRDVPGMRMNLAVFMCRQHIQTQERRGDTRYPEVFERYAHEPRFARLMGELLFEGWREEGPDHSKNQYTPVGLYD